MPSWVSIKLKGKALHCDPGHLAHKSLPFMMSVGWTLTHSSHPFPPCVSTPVLILHCHIFKGFSFPTQVSYGLFPSKLRLIDSSPAFLNLFLSSDWNNINPHCFSFYFFVFFLFVFNCNMTWPQYKLDNQAQWLENVTSEFQMLLDCDCFCHRLSMLWKSLIFKIYLLSTSKNLLLLNLRYSLLSSPASDHWV